MARSRLTPKALRIYERIGLLRPVSVDDGNGYRGYSPLQVHTGQLIGLLRCAPPAGNAVRWTIALRRGQ
jgi:DNA-binding transcriptional MerR regulator